MSRDGRDEDDPLAGEDERSEHAERRARSLLARQQRARQTAIDVLVAVVFSLLVSLAFRFGMGNPYMGWGMGLISLPITLTYRRHLSFLVSLRAELRDR